MVLLSDAGTAAAAQSVGIARASFETARDYVKEREAFGNRLIDHQAVAFQLADMATSIEAARSLAFAAAALLDAGRESVKEASMAKLFAGQVAESVCGQAVQLLGGYGYLREIGRASCRESVCQYV